MAYDGNGSRGFDPDEFGQTVTRVATKALRHLRWILLGVVGLVGVLTTYYQIEPEEVGLVLRFGRFVRTVPSGPHFKLPFWIEQVAKIPVERQLKQEFGFHTVAAAARTEYGRSEADQRTSSMLTGDLNVANVEWIVQYKINDPYKYVFRVRNVATTFRDMSEAAMRQVVGDRSVTEVLTVGREEIQVKAKEKLQVMCDHYETGIQVLQLILQDVNPPAPVRASFNEVNQAIQERERAINEAWAEYNRVIPEARGKAEQVLQAAEGYAAERINHARGNANRYLALQAEYARAPQVTRTRIYLETLAEVLPTADKRVLIDANVKGLLPLLPLGGSLPPSGAAK